MVLKAVPITTWEYLWRGFSFFTMNWLFLEFSCIFKEEKTKKKIFRQSWTNYLFTSRFRNISLHHKWSWTSQGKCKSCLTSCQMTKLRTLRKYDNLRKSLNFLELMANAQTVTQKTSFDSCANRLWKISSNISVIWNIYFT